MKLGTRRILSGLTAAALTAALSVPAMAADGYEMHLHSGENGDNIKETVSSQDYNKRIPSLNMTFMEALARYQVLEKEYDATSDAAEKLKIEKEMMQIETALKEAYPGMSFGSFEDSSKETAPSVREYIDYFEQDGMNLMWATMEGDAPENPTLPAEKANEYLRKLKELEGAAVSASPAEKEEMKKVLLSFRDTAAEYQNSEAVVTAVNTTLSRLSLSGQPTEPVAAVPFTDVPAGAWYAQDIADAQQLGIIQGKGNHLFDPNGTLTTAQAITLAAKTRAYYNNETISTVEGGSWYDGSVAYAKAQGIISGVEFSNYDANATRSEMAYLFARALPDREYESLNSITALPDVSDGTQYRTEIFKLYNAGIVTGSDAYGTFNPNSNISRAEAAAIINRVAVKSKRKTLALKKQDVAGAITIYEGQARSNRPAKVGDIVVKSDGTKVTLKLGPNGVLGEGQYVAPDLNLQSSDGFWKVVDQGRNGCGEWGQSSVGINYANDYYYVNLLTGEGHWGAEWSVITDNIYPDYDGKVGEISKDKNFVWNEDGIPCWVAIYNNPGLVK